LLFKLDIRKVFNSWPFASSWVPVSLPELDCRFVLYRYLSGSS
jgi:hypothetical protein